MLAHTTVDVVSCSRSGTFTLEDGRTVKVDIAPRFRHWLRTIKRVQMPALPVRKVKVMGIEL